MEKNIKNIIIGGFVSLLIIIFLIMFFSNKERYFEDINYPESSVPSGVNEIHELDGNQRYYKFIYSGDKAISVSYHDYDGTLKDFAPQTALMEFEYNDNGQLIRIISYDMSSKKSKDEKINPPAKPVKKKKINPKQN